MNIILASVVTLPELVNGKVCVIDPATNTYKLHKPSRSCIIEDNFNPLDYSILISDKYTECVIYSTVKEREHYLVNKQLKEMRKPKALKLYGKGDKIHIHSRDGIYEVVSCSDYDITITCKKWQYDADPRCHTRVVPNSDFKCVAGGRHNWSH